MDDFELVLASDVSERDGMLVELRRSEPFEQIAEVFEDDETGVLTFTSFVTEGVPLEAIETLIAKAHREFPSPHLTEAKQTGSS